MRVDFRLSDSLSKQRANGMKRAAVVQHLKQMKRVMQDYSPDNICNVDESMVQFRIQDKNKVIHINVPAEHVESKIMDWCRWRESNLLPVGRDIIDIIDVVQSIYSNSLENEEEWALQAQPVFGYTGPNGGWYRNFCEQAKEEPHACGLSLVGLTI